MNAEKSFFGQTETEYIGFWVSNNGVRMLLSKLEAIKSIVIPTEVRDIWIFLGLANYYSEMWRKRTHTSSFNKTIFNKT